MRYTRIRNRLMGILMGTKARKPFTEPNCRKLPAGVHTDFGPDRVPGLLLEVSEAGGRYWTFRYMLNGKRRDMGIGSMAEVTLEEAREEARQARRMKRAGVDPLDLRHKEQKKTTASKKWSFKATAQAVHETLLPSWKNSKHGDQWINTLETYAYPHIGERPVGSIEVADILAVLKPIWQEKAETAKRVRQRIDVVMRWAQAHGHTEINPVPAAIELLPKQRKKVEHHSAMPYGELPKFMTRIRALDRSTGTQALQLLILTACRSGEVRGADWSEIDLNGATWLIPADRMKADAAHRVPLSSAALALLNDVRASTDSEALVFPSQRNKPLSDMTLVAALRRWDVPHTVHGFRSSFRDWCAETGISRELAERSLAHTVKDKTEAAYHRTDQLEQRRPVMAAWADFLAGKSGNKVHPIRAA